MQASATFPRPMARWEAPPKNRADTQNRPSSVPDAAGRAFVAARTWLRHAYTDTGSIERACLAEVLIVLVIASMVATVLEFDESVAGRYNTTFLAVDALVTACFALDYALNVVYARSRKRYVLGPWGVIDLLAILPSVHWLLLPQMGKALRGLRFVRFLRVLKAAKDLRRRYELAGMDVPASVALPYEVFLVIAVPALLLVPDVAMRGTALGGLVVGTVTLALRQWLVHRQHETVALIVLVGSTWLGVTAALRLDEAGQATLAVAVVLATAVTALVSWTKIEVAAGQ